ncbi:MAG: hypothetical protein ABIA91_03130 [Patescibacteria group bacterium]
MKKKDLQKPVTLEVLSQFTEEVILPGVEKIMDNKLDDQMKCIKKTFATKKDLKAMENRMVSKDYLDKKLFEFEARLMRRISKEESKIKQALAFTMKIIRSGKTPTTKQIETLKLLEYELSAN